MINENVDVDVDVDVAMIPVLVSDEDSKMPSEAESIATNLCNIEDLIIKGDTKNAIEMARTYFDDNKESLNRSTYAELMMQAIICGDRNFIKFINEYNNSSLIVLEDFIIKNDTETARRCAKDYLDQNIELLNDDFYLANIIFSIKNCNHEFVKFFEEYSGKTFEKLLSDSSYTLESKYKLSIFKSETEKLIEDFLELWDKASILITELSILKDLAYNQEILSEINNAIHLIRILTTEKMWVDKRHLTGCYINAMKHKDIRSQIEKDPARYSSMVDSIQKNIQTIRGVVLGNYEVLELCSVMQ